MPDKFSHCIRLGWRCGYGSRNGKKRGRALLVVWPWNTREDLLQEGRRRSPEENKKSAMKGGAQLNQVETEAGERIERDHKSVRKSNKPP